MGISFCYSSHRGDLFGSPLNRMYFPRVLKVKPEHTNDNTLIRKNGCTDKRGARWWVGHNVHHNSVKPIKINMTSVYFKPAIVPHEAHMPRSHHPCHSRSQMNVLRAVEEKHARINAVGPHDGVYLRHIIGTSSRNAEKVVAAVNRDGGTQARSVSPQGRLGCRP